MSNSEPLKNSHLFWIRLRLHSIQTLRKTLRTIQTLRKSLDEPKRSGSPPVRLATLWFIDCQLVTFPGLDFKFSCSAIKRSGKSAIAVVTQLDPNSAELFRNFSRTLKFVSVWQSVCKRCRSQFSTRILFRVPLVFIDFHRFSTVFRTLSWDPKLQPSIRDRPLSLLTQHTSTHLKLAVTNGPSRLNAV